LAPVCKGFSAGKWKDGSEAYVGLGNQVSLSECYQDTVPGRINVQVPNNGVETECALNPVFDVVDGRYLKYHPKLAWKPATIDALVPNALVYNPGWKTFMIGRMNMTNFVIVSKLELKDSPGFWYHLDGKTYKGTTGIEALVCDP
jgi:hypothetical protein